MNTKLTLKIDKDVIERTKRYARARNTSVSKLIENHLSKITSEKQGGNKITPLVKSLSGIISLPGNYNHKDEYAVFLADKYK